MADKGKFSPYSITPLRSYGSKQLLEGLGDDPRLDTPIPSIKVFSSKSYLKDYNPNLKENQAPQNIPVETIKALAKSEAVARKNNLLPGEVIDYYLPAALVEGRFGDFGVNNINVDHRTAPSKKWQEVNETRNTLVENAFRKGTINKNDYSFFKEYGYLNDYKIPGLGELNKLYNSEELWSSEKASNKTKVVRAAANKLGFEDYSTEISKIKEGFTKYDSYTPFKSALLEEAITLDPKQLDRNASLKTLALVNKSQEKVNKSPLDYWTAYNGRGVAIDPKTKKVVASPEIYKRKLMDTQEVINHPANAELKRFYSHLVQGYLTGELD